ncbi:hypothetical protein M2344_001875 [Sphingobium sp. B8D3C]|nr:hypothetical protein [Sphingobium sp. B8D3B]MCW2398898.1 hypothetical protein [Sphingobium sp. B2D3C]MCW2418913.1 hypothetical protein [Sphingobium sp. B8D3C]
MPALAALRPDQHHQAIIKQPVGLKAILAIVLAQIGQRERRSSEDLAGISKVEAAFGERFIALCRIEADLHGFM